MKAKLAVIWLACVVNPVLAQEAVPAAPATPAVTNAIQLRVAGSSVIDPYGIFCGNIESVVIDPISQRALFAMVSTAYPSNRLTVTPIPWPLLQHYADARESVGIPGTFQQFKTSVNRLTILRAPKVQQSERTNDFSWITASYHYFNNLPGGAPGVSGGTQTGGESSSAAAPINHEPAPVAYHAASPAWAYGGGDVLSPADEYALYGAAIYGPDFLTNALSAAMVGTNLSRSTDRFTSLSNLFLANAAGLSNFVARHPAVTNLIERNRGQAFSNSFAHRQAATNLALFRSNFFASGFTSTPPVFPATNRPPFNPAAVGAPGAGTGVNTGSSTPSPTPQTPAPPAQPVEPAGPFEPYPKQPLRPAQPPARPVPAVPVRPQ